MTDVSLPVVATAEERRRKLFGFQPLALHLWDEGDWQVIVPTTRETGVLSLSIAS